VGNEDQVWFAFANFVAKQINHMTAVQA